MEINSILKDFYNISGIRISIHDTEFNEIYSYPQNSTPFCRCVQQNAQIKATCEKNDRLAFEKVKNSGKVYFYKCHLGLFEAVAPIYHYGTLSGYLMMGQICDTAPQSKTEIATKTDKILKNLKQTEEIVKFITSIEPEKINSYINVMTLLAEYITGTNRTLSDTTKLPALIKEYINKNYSSKITLGVLSQKFGCCNATMTNSFKKEYGITIMDYLMSVRLEKSAEMILKTRRSLKEIAFECGFYDQNYFSKSSTKYFGTSPSAYRNKNHKTLH